jgi:regulator of protease activity HflC (stomatin/prohibitin superfamily)
MFVAVLVCGAVFFVGRTTRQESAPGSAGAMRGMLIQVAAGILFVLWAVLHTAAVSVKQVEAGHVVVVYQFGKIVSQKSEGLQIVAPWQTTRTESVQVQRHKFENIAAFSKETQDVFISVTLNYQVSPGAVQNLFRQVGPAWFDRLIEARVVNFFKEETVKYQSVEVAPNRESIRGAVRERLKTELEPFSITVVDLLIDNIEFRPEFKTAIENKQIAAQDALREQERVKQKQFEAQQVVETSRGKADAIKIEADGQAAANKALAASLTPEVIQFQAIQKLAGNIQIALIPSGQGVIIDPTSLFGTATKK